MVETVRKVGEGVRRVRRAIEREFACMTLCVS